MAWSLPRQEGEWWQGPLHRITEGEEPHRDGTPAWCTVSLPCEELSRGVLPQDEVAARGTTSTNGHRSQIGPYRIPYARNERALQRKRPRELGSTSKCEIRIEAPITSSKTRIRSHSYRRTTAVAVCSSGVGQHPA